jgi:hypothetical protein
MQQHFLQQPFNLMQQLLDLMQQHFVQQPFNLMQQHFARQPPNPMQ